MAAFLLGDDGVERDLGLVGTIALPLFRVGIAGFVVQDEVSVGGGVDAVDAEIDGEGA